MLDNDLISAYNFGIPIYHFSQIIFSFFENEVNRGGLNHLFNFVKSPCKNLCFYA